MSYTKHRRCVPTQHEALLISYRFTTTAFVSSSVSEPIPRNLSVLNYLPEQAGAAATIEEHHSYTDSDYDEDTPNLSANLCATRSAHSTRSATPSVPFSRTSLHPNHPHRPTNSGGTCTLVSYHGPFRYVSES